MNLNAFYILPLVGLTTRSYGDKYFVESFLGPQQKTIVIELTVMPDRILQIPLFIRKWEHNHYHYLEYKIPDRFLSVVSLFAEGRYSEFPTHVVQLISDAIKVQRIEKRPTDADLIWARKQVLSSRHLLIIEYIDKGSTSIVPNIYAGIQVPSHPARVELAKHFSEEYNLDIPADTELITKPKLKDEIIPIDLYYLPL